jgi:hypothetical protein
MLNQNNLSITKNKSLSELFGKNPIITPTDSYDLKNCTEFIVDTYLSVPMYRTLPVKLIGVLNNEDFPTPEAKYWQCKAEAEVHSRELVRDLHDLEDMKINIEKTEYIYEKIQEKIEKGSIDAKELSFDARRTEVSISRQKFEYLQLEKRIHYRIEEVKEWKKISDTLVDNFGKIKDSNYADMLTQNFKKKWTQELSKPNIKEEDKKDLEAKLSLLETTLKINNQQS